MKAPPQKKKSLEKQLKTRIQITNNKQTIKPRPTKKTQINRTNNNDNKQKQNNNKLIKP